MKVATEISQLQRHYEVPVEKIQLVDKLGYDYVFTSENTGSDVMTPLGFVLAITKTIGVGTSLAVTGARSATAAASAFLTLSHLGKGRPVLAGIGNSSPTRIEGWHGQPWRRRRPSPHLRDYVAIMRKIFQSEFPLEHRGDALSVPYAGPGAMNREPMSGLLEPVPDMPILLGTGGVDQIKLTAEIADGWLSLGFAPGMMDTYRPWLEEGFARAKTPKSLDSFEIWSHVDVIVSDDLKAAMKPFKAFSALQVGQFARHSGRSIWKDQMIWRGYGEAAGRIEELWLADRKDEAAQAVPDEFIDDGWLFGSIERITHRAKRWRDAGPTGMIIRSDHLDVFKPIKQALQD